MSLEASIQTNKKMGLIIMGMNPFPTSKQAGACRRLRQRGGAAIEMALTLPVLMMCLFGGLNYGVVFYNKSVLANASREAARSGVVFSVPSRPSSGDIATVASRFKSLLISFDPSSASTFTVDVSGPSTPVTGNTLTVTVRYKFIGVARGLIPGLGNGLWLSSSTAMTYE